MIKNKAFFLVNFEGLEQSLGQTFSSFVPNVAFRAAVLAKSPALGPIINAYPVRQVPVDQYSDLRTIGVKNTVREDAGLFRLDYRFTDTSTAFLRYNIDNTRLNSPQDALGIVTQIPIIPQNLVLQFQHIFLPTLVNETECGLNRVNYHNQIFGTAPIEVSSANFDPISDNAVDVEIGTTFSFIDNLKEIVGHHTVKSGAGESISFQNQQCRVCDRSDSTYDTRHAFTTNANGTGPPFPDRP